MDTAHSYDNVAYILRSSYVHPTSFHLIFSIMEGGEFMDKTVSYIRQFLAAFRFKNYRFFSTIY